MVAIPGWASTFTLLTMAPATATPWAAKWLAFRTSSSMGRPTPPSLTITAGARRSPATTAFESPITAPTPRVAGPLDEQHVLVGREGGVGVHDPGAQVLHHLARDVGLGEAPRDVDRAHRRHRLAKVVDGLHEDRVLVGGDPRLVDHGPLSHGLHERRFAGPPPGRGPGAPATSSSCPGSDRSRRGRGGASGRREGCGGDAGGAQRGVVFRSTRASASLRRPIVSGSTLSGSRYGPRRSRMSPTRPRKTPASATKNWGSLL